ncbi:MAG: sporulation protein [Fusicatenibacter sp.]|nr:sporulation protein [Lachnospiraceae bacterium]MDY2939209.1 sporulation protein [Fusicatenibacter sp.]
MKRKGILFLILFLLLYLLLFPEEALKSSCVGVNLWFHTILPSLLPFLILSKILVDTGTIRTILHPLEPFFCYFFGLSAEGAYAWILGMFCGFPMGARLTAELYQKGRIEREEAEYLLTFSNHASPAFLSSYVVMNGFGSKEMLLPVFSILYLANLITCVCFRIVYHRFGTCSGRMPKKEVSKQISIGNLLDTSIMNGFEIITRLGGYIILFSIISGILMQLPNPFRFAALYLGGMIEITTGISNLSATGLSYSQKTIAILMCTAFGGLSTVAQTNAMIQESHLSIYVYLKGKLVCTVLTGLLGLLFLVK